MKIKITIGGNENTAIVLPIEHAGLASQLLAQAEIYERDGYYASSGWKKAEKGVQISYTEATELEPTHPKVEEAEKEAAKQRSAWYAEHQKRQALEKQLADLSARLEAIQSVTVCTQSDALPKAEVEASHEADGNDPELPF